MASIPSGHAWSFKITFPYQLLLVAPFVLELFDNQNSGLLYTLPIALWLIVSIGIRSGQDMNHQIDQTRGLFLIWSAVQLPCSQPYIT